MSARDEGATIETVEQRLLDDPQLYHAYMLGRASAERSSAPEVDAHARIERVRARRRELDALEGDAMLRHTCAIPRVVTCTTCLQQFDTTRENLRVEYHHLECGVHAARARATSDRDRMGGLDEG